MLAEKSQWTTFCTSDWADYCEVSWQNQLPYTQYRFTLQLSLITTMWKGDNIKKCVFALKFCLVVDLWCANACNLKLLVILLNQCLSTGLPPPKFKTSKYRHILRGNTNSRRKTFYKTKQNITQQKLQFPTLREIQKREYQKYNKYESLYPSYCWLWNEMEDLTHCYQLFTYSKKKELHNDSECHFICELIVWYFDN